MESCIKAGALSLFDSVLVASSQKVKWKIFLGNMYAREKVHDILHQGHFYLQRQRRSTSDKSCCSCCCCCSGYNLLKSQYS